MQPRILISLGLALVFTSQALAQEPALEASHEHVGMVQLPSGSYPPFFPPVKKNEPVTERSKRARVSVHSFWIDTYPVTQKQYLSFLRKNPEWRKSMIKPIFGDSHYLSSWRGDLAPSQPANSPITEVSWFAAQAYCHSQNKRLPTIDEWEYASFDQGRGGAMAQKLVLEWYTHPNSDRLPNVKSAPKNGYGIHGLHGLVWEWNLDFNSSMVSEESRESGSTDGNLFCGSGSLGALDPTDYASFMRYGFRSSLKANYTTQNLGFRCIREN